MFSVEGVGNYCGIVRNKRFAGKRSLVNSFEEFDKQITFSSEQFVADSINVNDRILKKSSIVAAAAQYCAVASE